MVAEEGVACVEPVAYVCSLRRHMRGWPWVKTEGASHLSPRVEPGQREQVGRAIGRTQQRLPFPAKCRLEGGLKPCASTCVGNKWGKDDLMTQGKKRTLSFTFKAA